MHIFQSSSLSLSPLYFFLFEKFTAADCSKENTDNTSQSDELNISWYITVVSYDDDNDMIPELQIQQCPQKSEGKDRHVFFNKQFGDSLRCSIPLDCNN